MVSIIATATRLCGACWISGNGGAEITMVASKSGSDRDRTPPDEKRAYKISWVSFLPMNVTLVHAVWAKSGPTVDLPKSSARASVPVTAEPGCAACRIPAGRP